MLPAELIWQKSFTVSDEKTAELLAHGTQTINVLSPFMGKENTSKKAALEANIKLNVMAYWVHKFFAAGILIRTRTEKRAGRPVHHYRAVADQIFVPTQLIVRASDFELLLSVQQQEYELFSANVARQGRKLSAEWCLHYFCLESVQHWTMIPLEQIKQKDRPLHDWSHLELSSAALEELKQELWDLTKKYHALNGQGSRRKRVTLHLGLAEIT